MEPGGILRYAKMTKPKANWPDEKVAKMLTGAHPPSSSTTVSSQNQMFNQSTFASLDAP
jgi:hypothetical protein